MAKLEISGFEAVALARLLAGDRKFNIHQRAALQAVAERIMCTPAFAADLDGEGFDTDAGTTCGPDGDCGGCGRCSAPTVGEVRS